MTTRAKLTVLATLVTGAAVIRPGHGATTIPLDPRGTYLHTFNDTPQPPAAIELATVGIAPGDRLLIEHLGGWANGPGGDITRGTIAVFSVGATLLDPSMPHRVPGAIDAGLDTVTPATHFVGEATDIPEDFIAGNVGIESVCVDVPASATHLFICALDTLYGDNFDPNGDYAVSLTVIECPDDCAQPQSGMIDVTDLLALLGEWGQPGTPCDTDCNGTVDVGDLLKVLGSWGMCP